MGLSETILAAIIGALATMATAIVQLVRNRAPSESRPEEKSHAFGARHHRADDRLHRRRLRLVGAARRERQGRNAGDHATRSTRNSSPSSSRNLTPTVREHGIPVHRSAAPVAAHDRRREARPSRWRSCRPAGSAAQPDEVGPVTCTERVAHNRCHCVRRSPPPRETTERARAGTRAEERNGHGKNATPERRRSAACISGPRTSESPISPRTCASVCLDVANYSVDDTLAVRLIVDYAVARNRQPAN